ncbi:MAG: Ni/Fe hydrogenase subunit alpha [Candidatus Thermoplasmatota archaeon]|nr:Ni/Fe hydrogenase subunit alpha [Candidatus Thermoplasmatota archaeon]
MKITKEIRIDHLARIEGKAGIEVEMGDEGVDVKLNVTEGPRFFEVITRNKNYNDAVAIFPRICSFCCTPHKLTPIEAVEQALNIQPSEQTKKLRDLLYIGNIIESHALHLYLLVIPDYLGYPDAFTVARKGGGLVKDGIFLKDVGAEVQTAIGSRSIHPENAIVGGFGKIPSKERVEKIGHMAEEGMKKAVRAVEFFAEYENPEYANNERRHLSIKPHNGYGVYGREIISSDSKSFGVEEYRKNLYEEVVPYSFAKRGKFMGEPYMVGALSRVINNSHLITGEAKELMNKYREFIPPQNCFANNFAQALEMVYFLERTKELASELKDAKEERIAEPEKTSGEGYAVTEAPRGLLVYYINIENNMVRDADVITPTAMFLPMMEVDIAAMADGLWKDGCRDENLIGKKVEMVARSYDPCISCSVHVTRL